MGIRPLCLGNMRETGAWVVASEPTSFDLIDADYARDVEPGEMVIIDRNGLRSTRPFQDTSVGGGGTLSPDAIQGVQVLQTARPLQVNQLASSFNSGIYLQDAWKPRPNRHSARRSSPAASSESRSRPPIRSPRCGG